MVLNGMKYLVIYSNTITEENLKKKIGISVVTDLVSVIFYLQLQWKLLPFI